MGSVAWLLRGFDILNIFTITLPYKYVGAAELQFCMTLWTQWRTYRNVTQVWDRYNFGNVRLANIFLEVFLL